MVHLFGILDPSRGGRSSGSGPTTQKPFFGGLDPDSRPSRAERELALLSSGYPLAMMPEPDDGDVDAHKLRFVSLFVPGL